MQVEIKNIKKNYGKKAVLSGVDITVSSGECVGVLGLNGSGKTTLLSILAGVQTADEGEFLCDGKDLFKMPRARSRAVGYVPQGTPLLEELTAYDNLFLWYNKDKLKKELKSGVLKMLGIDEFLKVRVSKLSGGMKKRLSIGCAMAEHPPIFLLDEPMSALDIECKQNITEYLNSYKSAGGIIILVTHDIPELELCDRCYIIKNGKAVAYNGDRSELPRRLS